jgi:hypothetical protein
MMDFWSLISTSQASSHHMSCPWELQCHISTRKGMCFVGDWVKSCDYLTSKITHATVVVLSSTFVSLGPPSVHWILYYTHWIFIQVWTLSKGGFLFFLSILEFWKFGICFFFYSFFLKKYTRNMKPSKIFQFFFVIKMQKFAPQNNLVSTHTWDGKCKLNGRPAWDGGHVSWKQGICLLLCSYKHSFLKKRTSSIDLENIFVK